MAFTVTMPSGEVRTVSSREEQARANEVLEMVRRGISLNSFPPKGHTPLVNAILHFPMDRDRNLIGLIMDLGADPNAPDSCGTTPLWLGVGAGRLDIKLIKALVRYGADPKASCPDAWGKDEAIVHVAWRYGRQDVMNFFRSRGIEAPEGPSPDNSDGMGAFMASVPGRATGPKTKPNEPCPCESGKKYKKCCGLAKKKTDTGPE